MDGGEKSSLMTNYLRDVVLVNVEASVVEAFKIIIENLGCLIVYEKSQPAGTVMDLDFVLKVMARE